MRKKLLKLGFIMLTYIPITRGQMNNFIINNPLNVTVTNCVLSSRSACISVGYGEHPIRNLIFSNLVMYESNRGIGVFARNKSRIENVLFDNIIINNRLHSGHWWGKGEPIHISSVKDSKNATPGIINNIRFTNITSTSETGISIFALPIQRKLLSLSMISRDYMHNLSGALLYPGSNLTEVADHLHSSPVQ